MEQNGKEKMITSFIANRKRYMSSFLAVENHIDYTGKNEIFKNEAFSKLKELRTSQSTYTTAELLSQSSEIVNLFEQLVKEIGLAFLLNMMMGQ